jgi:hypothetical protein
VKAIIPDRKFKTSRRFNIEWLPKLQVVHRPMTIKPCATQRNITANLRRIFGQFLFTQSMCQYSAQRKLCGTARTPAC